MLEYLEYKEINWKTLEFFKTHLYRRLTAPLNETINHLERLQVLADEGLKVEKLSDTRFQLEGLLNLVNAWAALISYKDSGSFAAFPHRTFTAKDVPLWIRSYLEENTSLRVDFTHPIYVHEETFLEAFFLLYQVASKLGNVSGVQLVNSSPKKPGVFMRVVFAVNPDAMPYLSLDEVENRFDRNNIAEWDIYMQLAVACDMLALNKGRFTLQNNKKTAQQALSAFFLPHEQTLIDTEREKNRQKTGQLSKAVSSAKTTPSLRKSPEPAEVAAKTDADKPAEPTPAAAPVEPAEITAKSDTDKPAETVPAAAPVEPAEITAKSDTDKPGKSAKVTAKSDADKPAEPTPSNLSSVLGNVTKILNDLPEKPSDESIQARLESVTKILNEASEEVDEEDIQTGLLKLLSRLSNKEIAELVARQKQLPTAPATPVQAEQAEGEPQVVAQIEGDPRAGEASTDDKTAEGAINPEEKQG